MFPRNNNNPFASPPPPRQFPVEVSPLNRGFQEVCREERFVNATHTIRSSSRRGVKSKDFFGDFSNPRLSQGGQFVWKLFHVSFSPHEYFFCWSHACNALQYLQWLNQRKTRLLNDVLLVAFFVPLSDSMSLLRYALWPLAVIKDFHLMASSVALPPGGLSHIRTSRLTQRLH